MLRASVTCERAGIPSVSVVCEGFERQAGATGRGLGFDGMALAILRGHVDTQSRQDMIDSFLATTVDQIVDGLTTPVATGDAAEGERGETARSTEPAALDIVARGTIDDITRVFAARGWSDGGAILPPTRAAVEAFIAVTRHDPWRILGIARPSGRDVTVWAIAVNAVMAGCRPEVLPVLLAIAEVLLDSHYGVEHSGNTTGADALVVVNGPMIGELGFHHGQGAMRDGAGAANTTVARWLRLFLRNVHGFTPEEHDKATFGNASRVVLAEDETALAELGWAPLGAAFGWPLGTDAVTVGRLNSGLIIGSICGATPTEVIAPLADGLTRVVGWDLTHIYGLGQRQQRPLAVLSPAVARVFGRAGWSKRQVQQALFERARIPAWRFEALIGDWSNLTACRRRLVELAAEGLVPDCFGESDDPDRLVPVVSSADRILVAVAGDPNRANAMVFSSDGPHGEWTSAPVTRGFSDDLACRVDGRACT